MKNRMMRGLVAALCAGAALAISGCGQSLCDRVESVNQSLESKIGDCENVQLDSVGRDVCEANIGKCSADDQAKINDQLDCMEQVSACQKGNELAWLSAMAECAKKAEGVSADCSKAFKSE
ncbi:MAG: hypothetical protein IRZ16_12105 [Myxococcaceae bacterium]|nr:hypothetical protein [Myxococcaceae bacterium]